MYLQEQEQQLINYFANKAQLSVPDEKQHQHQQLILGQPEAAVDQQRRRDEEAEDSIVTGSENDQQTANSAFSQTVTTLANTEDYKELQQVHQSSPSHSLVGFNSHVPRAQRRSLDVDYGEDVQDENYANNNYINWSRNAESYFQGGRNYLPPTTYHHPRQAENNQRDSYSVQVVPAMGYALDDPRERQAYFNAVNNGLLGEVRTQKKQEFYLNDKQNVNPWATGFELQSPVPLRDLNRGQLYHSPHYERPLNLFGGAEVGNNGHQQPHRPHNRGGGLEVESKPSIFQGYSSYAVALNSVGRLESDYNNNNINHLNSYRIQ